MLTRSDKETITASGVLCAAAATLLDGTGVQSVPLWMPAAATLLVAALIVCARMYVWYKGADQTRVDEALEQAESLIADARDAVRR